MKRYRCSIFSYDPFNNDDENWLGPFYVPVDHVVTCNVCAYSRREAAAMAFFHTVGRARLRKLLELNAPRAVIQHECDWRSMASQLRRKTIWLGDW